MQLERYLEADDRVVLPVGTTEQNGYLSVATDSIIAERIAIEAAEPIGVPVLPVLSYGVSPWFARFPGSPSLEPDTFVRILNEVANSLRAQGFARLLIINGHGGNTIGVVERVVRDGVIWHDWYAGPRLAAAMEAIGQSGGHASWTENFTFTRLDGVRMPSAHKQPITISRDASHDDIRKQLGDGSFGGPYQLSQTEEDRLWQAGVEDARDVLANGWSRGSVESTAAV